MMKSTDKKPSDRDERSAKMAGALRKILVARFEGLAVDVALLPWQQLARLTIGRPASVKGRTMLTVDVGAEYDTTTITPVYCEPAMIRLNTPERSRVIGGVPRSKGFTVKKAPKTDLAAFIKRGAERLFTIVAVEIAAAQLEDQERAAAKKRDAENYHLLNGLLGGRGTPAWWYSRGTKTGFHVSVTLDDMTSEQARLLYLKVKDVMKKA